MNLSRKSKPQSRRQANSADDKEQSKLFLEKAREIGADEKRSAADKLMERLAAQEPKPHKPSKPK
jgi:hypothetical protein